MTFQKHAPSSSSETSLHNHFSKTKRRILNRGPSGWRCRYMPQGASTIKRAKMGTRAAVFFLRLLGRSLSREQKKKKKTMGVPRRACTRRSRERDSASSVESASRSRLQAQGCGEGGAALGAHGHRGGGEGGRFGGERTLRQTSSRDRRAAESLKRFRWDLKKGLNSVRGRPRKGCYRIRAVRAIKAHHPPQSESGGQTRVARGPA